MDKALSQVIYHSMNWIELNSHVQENVHGVKKTIIGKMSLFSLLTCVLIPTMAKSQISILDVNTAKFKVHQYFTAKKNSEHYSILSSRINPQEFLPNTICDSNLVPLVDTQFANGGFEGVVLSSYILGDNRKMFCLLFNDSSIVTQIETIEEANFLFEQSTKEIELIVKAYLFVLLNTNESLIIGVDDDGIEGTMLEDIFFKDSFELYSSKLHSDKYKTKSHKKSITLYCKSNIGIQKLKFFFSSDDSLKRIKSEIITE